MELSIEEQYQSVLAGEGYLLLSQQELIELVEYITGVKTASVILSSDKRREVDCKILVQLIDYMRGKVNENNL